MEFPRVDEWELILYEAPEFVWTGDRPSWPSAQLHGLITSIRGVGADEELRRDLQDQLRALMLACHDLGANVHALGKAGQYRRTTVTRAELADLATLARRCLASSDDRDQQRLRIREHAKTLQLVTGRYLETCLMLCSVLRRDDDMPYSLDGLDELDLPALIEVVDKARVAIVCRPGPAGYPIARGLVDRLYDLCGRATDRPPRRSFGHPRGVKLTDAGGVETGWFLAFCRSVVETIAAGQPTASIGHKNLAKIVRTVVEERRARAGAAT